MDQDRLEFHRHAKEEQGEYPALLTKQAWSIKDLLCGNRILFPSRTQQVILLAWVANHSAGFSSSCPLKELATQKTTD